MFMLVLFGIINVHAFPLFVPDTNSYTSACVHFISYIYMGEYFGKGSLEQWMLNGILRHLIIMTSQYNIFRAK